MMIQSGLVESYHRLRELRCSYIRALTNYRKEGRTIIYTDETYIDSHMVPYGWVHEENAAVKCPVSKGKRLITVHAGGEQGFVDNSLLIYKSGQKSGDYHDDMNLVNYKKWLEESLITNLPPHSVIVLDNASYHNSLAAKHPTTGTKKCEMIRWLDEHNILHDTSYTKPELYQLIKQNKPVYKEYKIDHVLAQKGHSVLRLPPYHPELNPIEMIWGMVKNRVAVRNITFKLADVEQLTKEEFAKITAEDWSNVCRHVKVIDDKYIEKEHIMDNYCDEFIIHLGEDSEESDYDNYSSDDD